MADKADSKPKISLGDIAVKVLTWLIFFEVVLPHLKAFCITMRDQPWVQAKPTVVDATPEGVSHAA